MFFIWTVDEYTLDGEYLKLCEVDVNKDEIEMMEKNFNIPYWPWELPAALRKQMAVCILFAHNNYVYV